jgi:hypothetical protein
MDGVAWDVAILEFGRRFGATAFPGGCELYERFTKGDATVLEAVLRFLEADPLHFRSGYMKEAIWRRLARMDLDEKARSRLEQATLKRLTRPISRDFWYWCRAISRIAREDFRRKACRVRDGEGDELGPAHCLVAFLEDREAGESMRRRARDRWIAPWHEALAKRFS